MTDIYSWVQFSILNFKTEYFVAWYIHIEFIVSNLLLKKMYKYEASPDILSVKTNDLYVLSLYSLTFGNPIGVNLKGLMHINSIVYST